MQGLSSNGLPSSTSRWISLNMTATEELYKSRYSCFRRYSRAAELASPEMTSTLELYTYWRTFLKNFRTEPDAFIARSWWTWHTQQRILWRPDLVTNCLSLLSRWQSAVDTKLPLVSLPSWPRPQIPDCWKVYQLLAHANLWVILTPFCQTSPRKSLHVNLCPLRHTIPTEVDHIL